MALDRHRYTIDNVEGPLPRANRTNRVRYVYRITFTLGDRYIGTVEVDASKFDTLEHARAAASEAVEAEIAKISAIYSLGSG